MKITILYFAAVRDLVGKDEEEISVPDGVRTIGELAHHLEATHASLAGRLSAVRFAKNEVFAESGEEIAEGDVLALIPPVAGG